MKQPRKHTALLFIALGIIALLLLIIDMATGDTYIPVSKVWAVLTGGECDEMTRNILLSIRFIRVIVAALIGVALSVSGLQMQTVFQNPLADPYLLGVSSGAGLGVALFILGAPLLGWSEFPLLQSLGIVGSGWIGTAVILLGVAVISRKVKNILGVLIMGVILNESVIELLCRIAFWAPMLQWLFETVKMLNDDLENLNELDVAINSKEEKSMEDLQDIQKLIYEHRKGCLTIPNFFYGYFKDNDEDRAHRMANM